jgi:hypothetical protein
MAQRNYWIAHFRDRRQVTDALWKILTRFTQQRRDHALSLLILSVFVGASQPGLPATQGKSTRVDYASLQRLPSTFRRHVEVLGKRATEKDREETEFAGVFTDEFGKSDQARVFQLLSGEVVLEGLKDQKTLVFDGKNSFGETDRRDRALLETFALDTVEGLLASIAGGAALQVLGFGFGPNSRDNPDYAGPRYDIYDVTVPNRTRADRALSSRRYFFDSASGVLVRTRYLDQSVGRGVEVETRFSDWKSIEGSLYPGRVERFEDGKRLFTFQTTAIRNGPRTHSSFGSR